MVAQGSPQRPRTWFGASHLWWLFDLLVINIIDCYQPGPNLFFFWLILYYTGRAREKHWNRSNQQRHFSPGHWPLTTWNSRAWGAVVRRLFKFVSSCSSRRTKFEQSYCQTLNCKGFGQFSDGRSIRNWFAIIQLLHIAKSIYIWHPKESKDLLKEMGKWYYSTLGSSQIW